MIVVAPFSNDALRDWPRAYFRRLVEMLVAHCDLPVLLAGAAEQRHPINLILRGLPSPRVTSTAGLWRWPETVDQVTRARLVIANNSGIAHLGAKAGVPTLCLFAASHDPYEWGPRGSHVTTLYARAACAPCGMAGVGGCGNGHACMNAIQPEVAFDAARRLLARTDG
ncbi:ADP-heptose:LPS heptosyltransferase [Novosphingobium sp. SG751A]|uniref:glycosyltransferase family 9 protein n=1 Tax=Novosphingobium sp. SG751A TaxID=2587000 RepID=UPI00155608AC|nr:glycosyltransferase family 9 protein [Novosphingobium sp. SG751A]NOW45493.1 ADP-heptose:LPS heptosyltransferase [Novosphingobium sp. SG751A]